MNKSATFSPCGKYRYILRREWDDKKPQLCWIMLNPSTADANIDDPTIRRCMDFSMIWEYGGIHVVNLFGWRATNPAELLKVEDPIGPDNDSIILRYTNCPIVVAWGSWGAYNNRDKAIWDLLNRSDIKCLGTTRMGQPRHPLYIAKKTKLEIFQYLRR